MSPSDVEKKSREFYTSLFSVFSEDVLLELKRHQIDPVLYTQCAVCGSSGKELFYPKSKILPVGWGYCRYACYQLKPPPILLLEKNLGIDFLDLIKALRSEYESSQSRAKFARHLAQWVFGDTPMN